MPNTSVRHREESRRLYVKVLAETSYILIPTATYRQILYFVIPRPRSSCSLLLISWIASARVPLPFFPLLSPRNGDFRTHVSRVSSSLASDPPIFCRTNVLPVGEREEPLSSWTTLESFSSAASPFSSVPSYINFSLFFFFFPIARGMSTC